jgi:hypothetical protein
MSTSANGGSRRRERWIPRLMLGAAMLLIVGSAMLVAGCGGSDSDETAFTPVAGNDSAYCDTYWGWQAYKADRGQGDDERSPAAFRAWWNEYLIFNETALKQAPPVIHDQWVVKMSALRTRLTPLFETYNFDVKRMEREGTAAERVLAEPSPDVQRAEAAVNAYEDRVCGAMTAPAADVVFEADGSSKPYCKAAGTMQSEFDRIASAKFDPDMLRTLVTSHRFVELLDAKVAAAPAAIASDVEAASAWLRGRWSDVFEEFDYDIRGVWVDGSAEDRAVIHEYHPDAVEHSSRITAYEEQVCSA